MIKILANRYSVDESMIVRVLEGDKNITSYAQIKSVKSKGVSIKNKSITDITKEAIEDFNKSEENKENIEVPLVEGEKPKRKGGWQKGRPRGKKADKEKKEENNTLTNLNEILEFKDLNEEEYNIIVSSLEMRLQNINNKIISLEKEMDSINSIIKKLKKKE